VNMASVARKLSTIAERAFFSEIMEKRPQPRKNLVSNFSSLNIASTLLVFIILWIVFALNFMTFLRYSVIMTNFWFYVKYIDMYVWKPTE
jgi:hypothetical protein